MTDPMTMTTGSVLFCQEVGLICAGPLLVFVNQVLRTLLHATGSESHFYWYARRMGLFSPSLMCTVTEALVWLMKEQARKHGHWYALIMHGPISRMGNCGAYRTPLAFLVLIRHRQACAGLPYASARAWFGWFLTPTSKAWISTPTSDRSCNVEDPFSVWHEKPMRIKGSGVSVAGGLIWGSILEGRATTANIALSCFESKAVADRLNNSDLIAKSLAPYAEPTSKRLHCSRHKKKQKSPSKIFLLAIGDWLFLKEPSKNRLRFIRFPQLV